MADVLVFFPGWEEGVAHEIVPQMEALRDLMVEVVEEGCPVRTGYLLSTVFGEVDPDTAEIQVGATADYASQVDDRTGFLRAAAYQTYGQLS